MSAGQTESHKILAFALRGLIVVRRGFRDWSEPDEDLESIHVGLLYCRGSKNKLMYFVLHEALVLWCCW